MESAQMKIVETITLKELLVSAELPDNCYIVIGCYAMYRVLGVKLTLNTKEIKKTTREVYLTVVEALKDTRVENAQTFLVEDENTVFVRLTNRPSD